jgi:hypothetical protein
MLRRVDDEEMIQYAIPDYLLISGWIEVAASLLVVVGCLTLVGRGRPATIAIVGAVLTGMASLLCLAAYRSTADWTTSERFWAMTTYARAFGLALLAIALVLAIRRPRSVRA